MLACPLPLPAPWEQVRLTDEDVRVPRGSGLGQGHSACVQPGRHERGFWVTAPRLSPHPPPQPQPLTWPDTSPPQHSAGSTDGLSARKWTLARSWGPGPSQGGLEMEWETRRRGQELASRGVRLATANAQRPPQPQAPFTILLPLYRLSPPPRSLLT